MYFTAKLEMAHRITYNDPVPLKFHVFLSNSNPEDCPIALVFNSQQTHLQVKINSRCNHNKCLISVIARAKCIACFLTQ